MEICLICFLVWLPQLFLKYSLCVSEDQGSNSPRKMIFKETLRSTGRLVIISPLNVFRPQKNPIEPILCSQVHPVNSLMKDFERANVI